MKYIDVMQDPRLTLAELQSEIEKWIKLYGKDAVFHTDAGYNNVSCIVEIKEG